MPFYKTISHNTTTQIHIWEITEEYEDLFKKIDLTESSFFRLKNMKSELHQRAFLSVRMLLGLNGYSDFDLNYDDFGKPYLNDNKFISITHSHQFSAIIISDEKVGVDIEIQRDKIIRIADKFVHTEEFKFVNQGSQIDYIKKLTATWGAKEAIFKIKNQKGISFKKNIILTPFEMNIKKTKAILDFESKKQSFKIYIEEIKNYVLVYAMHE